MKLVEKATGKIVDVPDAQAQAAFTSGKFGIPKGAPMPVRAPGLSGVVDAPDASAALAQGMTPSTEEQYRQAQIEGRFGGFGGGAAAAGVGVARGAAGAFGVPLDAAAIGLAEMGGPGFSGHDEVDPYKGARHVSGAESLRETLKGLQEAHPIASFAGEMGGMVGAAALGGGVLGAAEEAGGALGGTVGRFAAGGAAQGGVSAINEAALGDEKVTAAKVLAGIGHGALIGGALGGAASLGGAALAGARDRFGRWIATMKPESVEALAKAHFGYAPEGLGERIQQTYARTSGALSGKDADLIAKFTELSPEGAAARRVGVFDADAITSQAERDIRTHIDDIMRAGDLVSAEARGGLKASYVDRAVKQGNEIETRMAAIDKLDEIIRGADEQLTHASGIAPNMKKAMRTVRELAARARAEAFGGGSAEPGLRFQPHASAKAGDVTVMVNADALDAAWSRDGQLYIGAEQPGIPGRREGFEAWRAQNPKERVQASRVHIDKDGKAHFIDGRHRFATMRDNGVERVAVTLEKGSAKNLGPEFEVGPLAEAATEAASSPNAQLFIALDQVKRGMQRVTASGYRSLGLIADPIDQLNARRAVTWLDGAAADVRSSLEDSELWGKAADDQRAINAAWTKQLDSSKRFHRSLTTEVGRDPNNPYLDIRGADPAKVSSYVKNLTNPNNDLTHTAVRNYVENTRDLADAISKSYDLPAEKLAEVARVKDAAASFGSTITDAEKTLVTANQYRALMSAPEGGTFADALGTVGGVIGGLPGGLLGSAIGAVTGAVRNPGKMIAQMAALERIASKVDNDVARGVTDFLSGAKVAGRAERAGSVEILAATGKSERAAFEMQVGEVRRLAGNKEELAARIRGFTEQFADAAPGVAKALTYAAIKGIEYLAQTAPPGFQPRPEALEWGIDEPPMYTDAEMREWSRRAAVVNNPLTVVRSMKRKMVTPEEADALKVVHTPIFEALQREFRTQRTEKKTPMTYGQQLQIEITFGVPLTRTLNPAFMGAVQKTFAVPEPPSGRTRGGSMKLTRSYASAADALRSGT